MTHFAFMKISAQNPIVIQLFCSFIAIVMMALTWAPVATSDFRVRFEPQALSLMAGNGYLSFANPYGNPDGNLETSLPPLYSLLIASLYSVGFEKYGILFAQFGMILLACNLLFRAIKPFSLHLAGLSMFMMALHPWTARAASYYLSEAFGVFISCALLYYFSKCIRKTAGKTDYLLLGLTLIALPLNSPAAMFLSAVVGLSALLKAGNFKCRLALILGVATLLIPWEIHCIKATGKFCPTLYTTPYLTKPRGVDIWVKTWAKKDKEIYACCRPYDIRTAPDYAFEATSVPREELIKARLQQSREVGAVDSPEITEKVDTLYRTAAEDRIKSDPISYYVKLPLIRAFNLWFDMPQTIHAQMEYVGRLGVKTLQQDMKSHGKARAIKRYLKAWISTITYLLFIFFPILALGLFVLFIKKRRCTPVLILSTIIVYSAITGYSCRNESRRNLIFLPVILFCTCWIDNHTKKNILTTNKPNKTLP